MNNPNATSLDFKDTISLQSLLRHILPWAPKLPPALAIELLRQKYIDFSRRTRILCAEITKDYQAGVSDYYLDAPQDYAIYSILGIEAGTFGNCWYGQLGRQFNLNFDVVDNNCVKLRNVPSVDQTDGLKVFVTLLPCECISTMPTSVATPFGKLISQGVVADALYMPNKEWSNLGLARRYELDYEKMLLSARALAVSNRKVGSNDIKPIRIL